MPAEDALHDHFAGILIHFDLDYDPGIPVVSLVRDASDTAAGDDSGLGII